LESNKKERFIVSCSLKLSVQIFRATSFSVYFFDCLDLFVCFVFIRNVILISLIVHVCLCFLSFFLSFFLFCCLPSFTPPPSPQILALGHSPHLRSHCLLLSQGKPLNANKKEFCPQFAEPCHIATETAI